MKTWSLVLAPAVLIIGMSLPARAADDVAAGADKAKSESSTTKVVDQSEEVDFERVTGWYFEGRGGIFFTLGGARGYSNGQPSFGFEVGYDVTDKLSVQFSYLNGYQASNPLEYPENCTGNNCSDYHLDFGMTFFNVSADYDVLAGQRWALEGRLGGGIVLINPSAKPDQPPVDGDIFGGVRFEYYTMLKHFTVGLECDFFYVLPSNIPSISGLFSILYTF